MWELFKDKNEYNEKNIIGFLSFALMCVFGIVDLAMGIIGIELMVNDYIYNSFVWVTLGSFGIAGAEKVYKKWGDHYLRNALESQMVKKKTRQGMSHNTKFGNKVSKKYYKKKYRGQGKWCMEENI